MKDSKELKIIKAIDLRQRKTRCLGWKAILTAALAWFYCKVFELVAEVQQQISHFESAIWREDKIEAAFEPLWGAIFWYQITIFAFAIIVFITAVWVWSVINKKYDIISWWNT